MVSSYVIVIDEVDDEEIAIEQLQAQMSAVNLQKNTVGIVSAHTDFVDSGVYAAIAEALPFPVAGMTTFSQTANGKTGIFLFSVLILTSDTAEFACGSSGAVTGGADVYELMNKCYTDTKSKLAGPPRLAFLYTPFSEDSYTGIACMCLRSLSAANPDLPIFGSIACCELEKILESKTLFGARASAEHFVLILAAGDISPRFYTGEITGKAAIVSNIGVVTAAKENYLMEINGINVKTFFEQMDYFIEKDLKDAALSVILIAEKKDENGNVLSSRAQGILGLTDNYAILEDYIEPGVVLSFTTLTKQTVTDTAGEVISQVKERGRGGTVLIYSCLSRWFALADDPAKESALINEGLAGSFNYLMSYSGGELCPVCAENGKTLNIKYSSSIIVCAF